MNALAVCMWKSPATGMNYFLKSLKNLRSPFSISENSSLLRIMKAYYHEIQMQIDFFSHGDFSGETVVMLKPRRMDALDQVIINREERKHLCLISM